MNDGTERLVRSWDAPRNRYKYSKIGLRLFENQTSSYLVSVPLLIKGKRANGTRYEIRSMMPAESLGIGKIVANRNLTEEQRTAKIKSDVLKNFEDHEYKDGMLVLYEFSDEIGYYDRDRAWNPRLGGPTPFPVGHGATLRHIGKSCYNRIKCYTTHSKPVRLHYARGSDARWARPGLI